MTEAELRALMGEREGVVDFKCAIPNRSEIVEYAVGIGNVGGGFLVLGVTDQLPRCIVGVEIPSPDEQAKILTAAAESAQIHLRLEPVHTAEGDVLVVHIPPRPRGMPLHTRAGKFLVRVDEQLRGMTMAELDAIRAEAGIELTARPVSGSLDRLIRPAGMEVFREVMRDANAPTDIMAQNDADLIRSLGLVNTRGELLTAGLLLVGQSDAIRDLLPHARWQFRRMISDTDYDRSEGDCDCIAIALKRVRELVAAHNPITTVPGWLVHPEFPRYPVVALRELLVNAFIHRDYEAPGSVFVKLYPDRIEITNPGGFVGGVTPENILHHPSTPRYPTLMSALTRVRLANESNLGVPRAFREFLQEGKEPPLYVVDPGHVRVVAKGQEVRREFLEFLRQHEGLNVDHLLVIHYLTRHREITTPVAARICQRHQGEAHEFLDAMLHQHGILETGGRGKGAYYRLSRSAYTALLGALQYHLDRRLLDENAKARVLAVLARQPLGNKELREITQMSRYQVVRLMDSLRTEGRVRVDGKGSKRRWVLVPGRPMDSNDWGVLAD